MHFFYTKKRGQKRARALLSEFHHVSSMYSWPAALVSLHKHEVVSQSIKSRNQSHAIKRHKPSSFLSFLSCFIIHLQKVNCDPDAPPHAGKHRRRALFCLLQRQRERHPPVVHRRWVLKCICKQVIQICASLSTTVQHLPVL